MTILRWDYETFSRANLRTVGAWRYAMDPSTVVLCLGWAFDDDEPKVWDPSQGQLDPEVIKAVRDGVRVRGWNVNFERAITECVMFRDEPRNWPRPRQWDDTAARAAMCALPRALGNCATVLGVREQKDPDGARLLNLFSAPQRTGLRVMPSSRPEEFRKLKMYCAQDVRAERSVDKALPISELPEVERTVWRHDSNINRRGIAIDIPLCEGAVKIAEECKDYETEKIRAASGDFITSPGCVAKIRTFCARNGIPLGDCKKETIELMLERDDISEAVREVLEARHAAAKAAVAKYATGLKVAGADGRVRGSMKYHGAGPGRWTGEFVQFQNLARPTLNKKTGKPLMDPRDRDLINRGSAEDLKLFYPDPMLALRDSVRNMVIAPKGKTLVVADMSSIEARVLGWLAGEQVYQKAFAEGKDLYKITAADIYGLTYDTVDKELHRPLGKESVLGLGYGMGYDTFLGNCAEKGLKAEPDVIRRAVKSYRTKYRMITLCWSELDKAAIQCVSTGRPTSYRLIKFTMVKGYLVMRLPSGRGIWYPEARMGKVKAKWGEIVDQVTFKEWVVKGQRWADAHTYGGRLTENAVQGIARDLEAEGIVIVEEEPNDHEVVMHTHDEIVAEAREDTPDASVLIDALTRVPSWGKGLILGASGFVSTFYRKG